MSPGQTTKALLARGFDSKFAQSLAKQGYSLNRLMKCKPSELKNLGLNSDQVAKVHDGSRPPIPTDTVNKLLYESCSICCMCRINGRPIIIHHINPWNKSRNHNEDNLVVLCLNCHGDVHTHRELSLNITASQIRDHKARWLANVKIDTLNERLTPSPSQFGMAVWDYFNHKRLLDVADATEVQIQNAKNYKDLFSAGLIEKDGVIRFPPRKNPRDFNILYDAVNRSVMTFYMDLLGRTVPRLPVVDLTESWNRSTVSLLESGSVVIFAGGWRFKRHKRNGPSSGPGQMRTGYVQKHGIRLTFDFDSWETTTCSSWGHLAGSWSCTGICLVRSVERDGKELVIQATALAIGTGFKLCR